MNSIITSEMSRNITLWSKLKMNPRNCNKYITIVFYLYTRYLYYKSIGYTFLIGPNGCKTDIYVKYTSGGDQFIISYVSYFCISK